MGLALQLANLVQLGQRAWENGQLLTVMVAVLVLPERFSLMVVRAIVLLVHQDQSVLWDLLSARYVQQAQKQTQIQIIVYRASLDLFSLRSARQIVNCAPLGPFNLKPVRLLVRRALRDPFSPKLVKQLVHHVLRDPFSLKLVKRLVHCAPRDPFSLKSVRQLVHRAPLDPFSPKLVRRVVNLVLQDIFSPKRVRLHVRSALKELSSPPMGKLHASHAPPEKLAYQDPQSVLLVQKEHFLMKLQEVVNHVTTT